MWQTLNYSADDDRKNVAQMSNETHTDHVYVCDWIDMMPNLSMTFQ